MDLVDFQLIRLTSDHQLKPFDCTDIDLNDFFHNEAKQYQEKLLAVTYLIENETETVAFFSLMNDKISLEDFESKTQFLKRVRNKLPIRKRHKSYPAMKIGRLGVSASFQNKGIGRMVVDYLKHLFIVNNRTGCKFVTVDAYKESLAFYEKNDFEYLTSKDKNADTRLMFFDLIKVISSN